MKNDYIIINGPNLNLLGKREPTIYGNETFDSFFKDLKAKFHEVYLTYFQSNHEGYIIDKLHDVGFRYNGIIINPGAYTHYSYAIADALKSIDTPAVEVHISDIDNREDFRKNSVTGVNCIKTIKGKGLSGYEEALQFLIDREDKII